MRLNYIREIEDLIFHLKKTGRERLQHAKSILVETIREQKMIHIFGTGHSHILAEEAFYRAGGLACVRPILIESLMLHKSGWSTSENERKAGYARSFMEQQPIDKKDTVIVVSTSGRNPVPIDVAMLSKEKGARVIAISSLEYSRYLASRHPSGKLLTDVADVTVDNLSPIGDAILEHPKVDTPYGPSSTVMGIIILHTIFSEAIEELAEKGIPLPIFKSGNMDEADEYNKNLIEQYCDRNEFLK
ncbi:putative phosphosugar-binding protein [Melghiribacillus thermohalophilus]|uniref:UPF0309 protein EDD68_12816 n=1 Tax=Melghiribacillus thermohalophilus TaxID=1324956 RepID=A0A4R3MUD0_9BACI|nr:SIS domain-containing protein [Melghiribacillus thermohalophilus]TCT17568.1 putative phosphosugar-binding protein [Melghiribacillus thermohalophilus]